MNPVPFEIVDEKKLSVIRRYFYESVLVALCICVLTLFYMVIDLSKYIRVTLTEQTVAMKIIIIDNTNALKEANRLIDKNKNP